MHEGLEHNKGGNARPLCGKTKTLKPGQALKKHITPVDVFFVVLEGTGIVEIGEEKQEVGPDMLIESPARIPHCWYNESDCLLRILVVKVP